MLSEAATKHSIAGSATNYAGVLQRKCACGAHTNGGGCSGCDNRKSRLRRAAISESFDGAMEVAPPIVHDVLNSPGRPLDTATRTFMEPRFGYDFSRVRLHDDSRALASARSVNARAYTVGEDIVLGSREDSSPGPSSQFILAHELAHVVQQSNQPAGGSIEVGSANDPAEADADAAAQRVLSHDGRVSLARSGRSLRRLGANPGCTPGQAAAIHQAIFNANSWARKAITALSASPLTTRTRNALTNNFGATGIANAGTILTNLRAGRRDMLNNPYSCTNASNDTFCAANACGDTVFGGHASNICTNVTLAITDAVYRAGCVLHEAMHASDATMSGDFYSGWFGHSASTPGYPGASPLTNVDSYTTLAMELS